MKVYPNAQTLIGNTPLVRLTATERAFGLKGRLFAKLEFFNPTGSVKDRTAKGLIDDAENRGKLKKGGTVIEPTSGNTGIALAMLCAQRGYRAVIVMPETMSIERRRIMQSYGAQLVLTEGSKGMAGAIARARELESEIENSFIPDQFENPANAAVHYNTTGVEIYDALDGDVSAFVTGVGTGGTFTGIARYLKEKNPAVFAAAVEPSSSNVLSGGKAGKHAIQGIGAGFIPGVLDRRLIDEVITCTDADSIRLARFLAKEEGLSVGISSGASLFGGIALATRKELEGKNVVTLFPDGGAKYLSTELFED